MQLDLPLLIFYVGFAAILIFRIPIAFGMLATATVYMLAAGVDIGLVAEKVLTNLFSVFIIIAVPLFVFTAKVMNTGKVTDMVFDFANGLVGRFQGGLGHVNVVASIIFSGMTGSAVADASGLGLMEIEAMRKRGYDDGFSCAITAASATIGPIFPPSIPMIFYAMLSGASIGALFMGGMIPGLLIGVALMIYIAIIAQKRNYPRGLDVTLRIFLMTSLKALPALFTPVILLGGIYSGVVTPTEAGALAGFYAIIVAMLVYRLMGVKQLYEVTVDTVKTTGTLSLIVGAAFTFSFVVAREQIPQAVGSFLLTITENKYMLLLLINVLFLLLGMFIDTSTIMLVFIPMVLPLVNSLGIDLTHFGVMIVLNMMIGLSTPPFGMLLFIVSGISGTPLGTVIKESLPMVFVLIIVLFLITYIPEIVLFLPQMFGQ
ncbi:MAG: Sialic acid TRAP transporter large permease protein SiaM [Anaerolineae bacterium]|nr:Sialic acid TRAP transporter large permease protein SiaM [Anaerolineae bacterium]